MQPFLKLIYSPFRGLKGLMIALITTIVFCSCNTTRQLPPSTVEREVVTIVEHDTTIVTTPDTAIITALLRCSEDNRILLTRMQTDQGERTHADLRITKADDGVSALLTIECAADSLQQELTLRDKEIERLRETTNTILVPRDLAWWQTTLIITGAVSLIILSTAVVMSIIRYIKQRR